MRYHGGDGGFREQMAVLRLVGSEDGHLQFLRSFVTVCQPGMSGFDPAHPGEDTPQGWKNLDAMIENENVRGTFHTHPPGFYDFSVKDWQSMKGLAMANGMRPIYHGVQAVDQTTAHFICLRMVGGVIHQYDFGFFDVDIHSPVIVLPAPPDVQWIDNMTIFSM